MFENDSSLNGLDVSHWAVPRLTVATGTFSNDAGLTAIDLSNWKPVALQTMSNLFAGDSALKALDISQIDMRSVKMSTNMLDGTTSLAKLTVGANTVLANSGLLETPKDQTYTGLWVGNSGKTFTAANLMAQYAPDLADTYVWQVAPAPEENGGNANDTGTGGNSGGPNNGNNSTTTGPTDNSGGTSTPGPGDQGGLTPAPTPSKPTPPKPGTSEPGTPGSGSGPSAGGTPVNKPTPGGAGGLITTGHGPNASGTHVGGGHVGVSPLDRRPSSGAPVVHLALLAGRPGLRLPQTNDRPNGWALIVGLLGLSGLSLHWFKRRHN